MSKFKVGDVVKRVLSNNGDSGARIGQVAVVKSVDKEDGFLGVEYEGGEKSYRGYEGWNPVYVELHTPSLFTTEQLEFLSSHFNISEEDIEKEQKKTIRVSDGWVESGDSVWWKNRSGPEFIKLSEGTHLTNVKTFPEFYSIKEPEFLMIAQYI